MSSKGVMKGVLYINSVRKWGSLIGASEVKLARANGISKRVMGLAYMANRERRYSSTVILPAKNLSGDKE